MYFLVIVIYRSVFITKISVINFKDLQVPLYFTHHALKMDATFSVDWTSRAAIRL